MLNGLANQHPVERVTMQCGKLVQVNTAHSSSGRAVIPCFSRCSSTNRSREAGTGSFPRECLTESSHTDHTEQDLIAGIGKNLRGRRRQFPRSCNNPQEGTGIEETPSRVPALEGVTQVIRKRLKERTWDGEAPLS